MKKVFFIIVLVSIISSLFSQNKVNYEIKIKINGLKDTVIYLGNHFGTKQYVFDTAKVDSKGNAVFKANKNLEKGIYLVALPSLKMRYFELLISDSYNFSIETDTSLKYTNIKVKGSAENTAFYEYQKKYFDMQKEYMELNKEYTEIQKTENQEKIAEIRLKVTDWQKRKENYLLETIGKNPKTFFSKILSSMLEIKIQETPKDTNGEPIDPDFPRHYYIKHYWDNIDVGERGFLRTPIYESRLDYFIKILNPIPDSLFYEINNFIRKVYDAGDSLMFQYTATRLLTMYDTSKIIGYDAVMVSIAEEWFLSGKAFWVDTTSLKKIKDRVDKITPTKIGNIAYNMQKMQSIDDKYYTLHNIPAEYLIIIFYEPSCGHCKKVLPKLVKEYSDTLKAMGVKVFSVNNLYDREEWLKFIDDKEMKIDGWYNVWDGPYPHSNFKNFYDIYSTPTIFILDKDKKIICKRLGVEQIKDFLLNYEKKLEYENSLKPKK